MEPTEEKVLEPPEEFSFPFQPYEIQTQFMKALFTALEGRKFGIFESPTGTGKSLSLLCGSLTWLATKEEQRLAELHQVISNFDLCKEEEIVKNCENWITAQANLRKKKEVVDKARRELQFMEKLIEKRKTVLRKRKIVKNPLENRVSRTANKNYEHSVNGENSSVVQPLKDDFQLEDLLIKDMNDDFAPNNYSDESDCAEEDEEEPEFYPTKVIFASRTHSQLGQFANELKRTAFKSTVTCVSLGSRQNLCINPDVTRLKSLPLMNERCLDLQSGSKGKSTSEGKKRKECGGCPFFKHSAIEELKNHILSEPMDIEDLVKAAKTEFQACPYYASRKASKEAQLVLLPYNTILHKGTREGVGIKMNNSALLLDEAHNIVESISNMYSNYVSCTQLEECSSGLKAYMDRYKGRFTPKNLLMLKQIFHVLKSLMQYFVKNPTSQEVMSINEFKAKIGIENLDLYEIQKYLQRSKLIFKLKGYLLQAHKISEKKKELIENEKSANKTSKNVKAKGKQKKSAAVVPKKMNTDNESAKFKKFSAGQSVMNFSEFLKSLLTFDDEGRILYDGKVFKFLLLNTSEHFSDVLKTVRSVILAGGTMKPYDEIEDQLFHSAVDRITHFSCDHVIPKESLVCLALTKGPSGTPFDFTFKNRNSPALMEELCRTIMNVIRVVPGGVVCFLPSYEYENTLYTYLKKSGSFEKIESKKRIFRESKEASSEIVLSDYSRQIRNSSGGALLFAVVGGKLSEGINFSDSLGRCILVVGLPFPNITSVEIKEKVQFITDRFGREKGSNLLSNMCSKAVNQSIGRAIRHSLDYASIILIDQRFAKPNQQALLPNWIRQRFRVCEQFGQAVGVVAKFFFDKKEAKPNV